MPYFSPATIAYLQTQISGGGGGTGDVVGPASSVNNRVVFFNGVTGKLIKDSGLDLSGSNTGDETTATIKSKLGITTLSGSNTGDQTIQLTGDATGSGTGSFAVTVAKINGVAFSGLATGLLKNTTGTGVPSIATAGTDYLSPPAGTALLKANSGGALANATAGTDYLAPPAGTAILKANSGGALANATAGTDYLAPPAGTSILKGNSGGALANATAGTDYTAGTSGLATGILKNTTGTGAHTIAVAADFPTLNQNTTGSAATLSPGRNINGVAFNGSADITVTVPIATGVSGLAANVAAFLAAPSSANMSTMLTDETGTGNNVFSNGPTISKPILTTTIYHSAPAPTSIAAAATLTAAQLLAGKIQYTGAAAALTLPTGTLMDAAITSPTIAADQGFDFVIINTGAGAATLTAGATFTIVGAAAVAAASSARFEARKTAANTFVAYRIG